MNSLFCVIILFVSIHLVQSQQSQDEVTELTDLSWEDTISGIWLVKFYAPWCGHCKQYAPVFKQTATITSKTNGYINFGEIDCDSNKLTCGEHNVKGYPTTLLLYNGKLIANYKESRKSATKIKSWIMKKLNPSHLRDAAIFDENEINAIIQIQSNWHKNKMPNTNNNQPQKNKQNRKGNNKLFPWQFTGINDFYAHLLGDTHPTVPFVIYLIGTLSGIIIGVSFVFCAGN